MDFRLKKDDRLITDQNISYYDLIAEHYDQLLDCEEENAKIRAKVASYFCNLVDPGTVLDFGGGTGRDLGWLTAKGFTVIFCEPSFNMRKVAVSLNKPTSQFSTVTFLEDPATDFTSWGNRLPFHEPVDAILCNFAVINSISNIDLLFKNFALVARKGGHLIMLVLAQGRWKPWQTLLVSKPRVKTVTHRDAEQKVFLYPPRLIKAKAQRFFQFVAMENCNKGFLLMHFIKK